MKRITTALIAGVLLLFAVTALSDIPQLINFQGVLTDGSGTPIANDTRSVEFRIWNAAAGGASKWVETQNVTTDADGRFIVVLGAATPIPDSVFKEPTRWLGIRVASDAELIPRSKLNSTPFSYRVSSIDEASGGSVTGNIELENSSTNGGNIFKGGTLFIHNKGGTNSTFIGLNAGNLSSSGSNNTASGASALTSNTSGSRNTVSGSSALENNTTGFNNTAIGNTAMRYNIDGFNNTAIGYEALRDNTTNDSNTAVGFQALRNATTAFGCTSIGASSMFNSTSIYAGTAVGYRALLNNTTGDENTAVGYHALYNSGTGNQNTAIGAFADIASGGFSNSTAIGFGAQVNTSNKIRLGNTAVTVIEGEVAYTFTSNRNQKENFRSVDGNEVLKRIREIKLTSWNFKGHDPKKFRHYGPMAQDFYAAFGNDGFGQCGDSTTINSGDMAGILMIAVQTLSKENEQFKTENADLKARIEKLEKMVSKIGGVEIAEK